MSSRNSTTRSPRSFWLWYWVTRRMGARVVGTELAKTIVNAWLASEFDPAGPSAANVAAIGALDSKYRK